MKRRVPIEVAGSIIWNLMGNFLKPQLSTKWAKNESLEVRHMVRFKGTDNYNPYFIQVDGSVIFFFRDESLMFETNLVSSLFFLP